MTYPEESPPRGVVVTFVVLGLLIMLVVGVVCSFVIGHACSGDGATKYAALDSPQGRICSSTDDGGLGITLLLLVPVALFAFGLFRVLRSATRRARNRAALLWLPAIPLAQIVITLGFTAPSNTCSAEDEAAYRAWEAENLQRLDSPEFKDWYARTHGEGIPPPSLRSPPAPAQCNHY